MSYYFSKTLRQEFDMTLEQVREELQAEGFGILTEIDVQATLKKKLSVDFRPYMILGACAPAFAYAALQVEDKVGTMLPCNVIVQQKENGEVEVAAVDPLASMSAIPNEGLMGVASVISGKLHRVIDSLPYEVEKV